MTTTPKALGASDEPGMKEIRPGVRALRVYVGRSTSGRPIQRRRLVDSGTGKMCAGVREARTELAKMRTEVQDDGGTKRLTTTTGYTVTKLLDRYLAHCEQKDLSPTTVREYRRIATKVIGPRLGKARVADLDQDHLDALYAELKAKGLKSTSIRRVHALMSASLRFGQKKKVVKYNVAAMASPPLVRTAEVEAPSVDEVRRIITAAEDKGDEVLAAIVAVAALTGARRGELCALRWSDIDSATHTLTIAQSVYRTANGDWLLKSPKTHQKRRLSLDEVSLGALRRRRDAAEALAAQLELELPPDAFVFTESPQGLEPIIPDVVTQRYAKVAKSVGITTHFHALRHFMGTQAIANGYDVVTVAKRLGHADATTTLKVYAHALEARDRDLAAAMGGMLGKGA
jgi:integrase